MIISFSSIADAKIKSKTDSFDGTTTIASEINNKNGLSNISFVKFLPHNFYALFLSKMEKEWWFFGNKIELKVDGQIYVLDKVQTSKKIINGPATLTGAAADIPDNILLKIADAKEVVIRVNFENQPPITCEIPDKVLKEWKEVIETKEP